MSKRVAKTVMEATQKTLEEWSQKIKKAIMIKEEQVKSYEEKKRELLPQLLEAHEKKVSTRELSQITGIPHTTIAKWIRETKKEIQEEHGERPP